MSDENSGTFFVAENSFYIIIKIIKKYETDAIVHSYILNELIFLLKEVENGVFNNRDWTCSGDLFSL